MQKIIKDDGTNPITDVQLRSIGKNELSKDDISILQELEKKNQITYQDNYVSEFLKCRNNIFYFIHNYVHIGEVGNARLYTADMMNRKYLNSSKIMELVEIFPRFKLTIVRVELAGILNTDNNYRENSIELID